MRWDRGKRQIQIKVMRPKIMQNIDTIEMTGVLRDRLLGTLCYRHRLETYSPYPDYVRACRKHIFNALLVCAYTYHGQGD